MLPFCCKALFSNVRKPTLVIVKHHTRVIIAGFSQPEVFGAKLSPKKTKTYLTGGYRSGGEKLHFLARGGGKISKITRDLDLKRSLAPAASLRSGQCTARGSKPPVQARTWQGRGGYLKNQRRRESALKQRCSSLLWELLCPRTKLTSRFYLQETLVPGQTPCRSCTLPGGRLTTTGDSLGCAGLHRSR